MSHYKYKIHFWKLNEPNQSFFLFLLVNRHIMIMFFLMLYWSVSWYLQYIYLVTVEHC